MTGSEATLARQFGRLRLLATSDLHMNLTGFDYTADRPDGSAGLAALSGPIAQARAEAEAAGTPVLLFDNGDGLQGTPMDEVAMHALPQPHPLMRAFGHLRYDVIGLGNHDFNFGLDRLLRVLDDAPCPVICSNLRWLDRDPPPTIRSHLVLPVVPGAGLAPVQVGVLSFLPPQTTVWDAHLLRGRVAVDDIVGSARGWIERLRGMGCDLIVALAHSGLSTPEAGENAENAVIPLAALPGIDAVIAGHTHHLLPDPSRDRDPAHTGMVQGKPVVMPGADGSHLGVIDLDLGGEPDGWRVLRTGAELRAASRAPVEDGGGLAAVLAPAHRATRRHLSDPAGRTDRPLHSYFSFFAPDRSLALVAAAQAAALRRHLRGTEAEALPVLSAASPCRFGGRAGPRAYTDIPAGPLCLRHLADLYAFPNDLRCVIATGADLLAWLEKSAGLFRRIVPGSQGAPLLDPDVAGHNFDVLHGLTCEIDLSAPAAFGADGPTAGGPGRIRRPCWQDMPLNPDQRFAVALNSYRASGGGGFPGLPGLAELPLPDIKVRDALGTYLTDPGEPDPLEHADPPWRFKTMPGTTVTVPVGPGARAHLGDVQDRLQAVDGPDRTGFLRLLIRL